MRKLRLLAAALLAALFIPTTAGAAPFPHSIPLPVDFQPEGIAVGTGSTFYVGSLWDGDIYRGDLRSGNGAVFINVSGRQAVGMTVDEGRHMLFVAGGFSGHAYVYDTDTGATLTDLTLGTPGATLVNDVTVTRDAAYFTDTFAPKIYEVPITGKGSFGSPRTITVSGPAAATGDFGLNGIAAPNDGSILLVNHTALGVLATVDPRTGASRLVTLSGGSLVPGTLDGLIVRGRTAWVVQNFANSIAEVELDPGWASGTLVRTITDPGFKIPTTVALHGNTLAAVNGRFNLGFPPPLGLGAPRGTTFDVILVPRA